MILTKKRAVAGAERRIFDLLRRGIKVADAGDKTAVIRLFSLRVLDRVQTEAPCKTVR